MQENDDEYQTKYWNSNQSSLFIWFPSRNAYQLRNKKGMETSKSIPKNKIKNKKGQQNEKFATRK